MDSAAGRDLWDRTWLAWDLAFGVAVAVVAVSAADELDGDRRTWVVVLLALIGVWYAAIGARALRSNTGRMAVLYLSGLMPLFLGALAGYASVGLLFFVVYPQLWSIAPTIRAAIWATVLLTAGAAGVSLLAFDNSPLEVAVVFGVQVTFAIAMGLWISGIIQQSLERKVVIAELEAARAELAAVSHRAGELAERERMAREIHDTLAQGFTSVLMLLELADSEVDADPAAARRRLAAAQDTARRNLTEARALVAAQTPADLQGAPLPEAVGRLVDRFGRETGQPASFAVAGPARALPANQDVVLLRAAQEALANVRKHAGSCAVTVSLRYEPDGVALRVADDGSGFDPAAATSGYGLAGMRGRAAEAGGAVTVHTGGSGTVVEVRCSG